LQEEEPVPFTEEAAEQEQVVNMEASQEFEIDDYLAHARSMEKQQHL